MLYTEEQVKEAFITWLKTFCRGRAQIRKKVRVQNFAEMTQHLNEYYASRRVSDEPETAAKPSPAPAKGLFPPEQFIKVPKLHE